MKFNPSHYRIRPGILFLFIVAGLVASLLTMGARHSANASAVKLQLQSEADVANLNIGVLQGSAHDVWARKNYPNAKLSQFVTVPDLLTAVELKKVDAGFADEETLREAFKTRSEIAIVGKPLYSSDIGAGFRKDSEELRLKFNAFIAKLRNDRTLKDIEERWIKGASNVMPQLQFASGAKEIVIANTIIGLPGVAVQDNQLIGYDVELAMRFAQSIGRKPKWLTVDWGALIPSLVSGKADLVVSSMYITPERRERIDFSEPYRSSRNFIFAHIDNIAGANKSSETIGLSLWQSFKDSFESNIIREDRYMLLLDGLVTTVILSIASCLFGTFLGGVVCYCRMSKGIILPRLANVYIAILRGTPVLVLLMIMFYVIFGSININPIVVAIIAFGLNFAAYVAEIFRAGIQSIHSGQSEAAIAMGFSRYKTFLYVIFPQTLQRILPVYKGEFISMVKMTSIVGYVAVQDLTKASDIIRSRTFDAFFPLIVVAILYFLISWVLIQALEYFERRTDPYRRRDVEFSR